MRRRSIALTTVVVFTCVITAGAAAQPGQVGASPVTPQGQALPDQEADNVVVQGVIYEPRRADPMPISSAACACRTAFEFRSLPATSAMLA